MTRITRRATLGLGVALAAPRARAQSWPQRPVRIIVPFPAGGPADAIARIVGERLQEMWGRPVVVEARPGAGGNVAAEYVARAAPDGHTLLLCASSHVQGAALYRHLPFDPVRDFTPIAQIAYYSLVVVVHPSVPVQNLREFEQALRTANGQFNIVSAGVGTPTHLSAELFGMRANLQFTHVPFQGAAPAHTAMLAGQGQAMFHNPVLAVPAIRSGMLRPIATTGAQRAAALPDIPTLAESGYPGFEAGTWYAVLGPRSLPPAIVEKIAADLRTVVATDAVRQRFATQSLETRDAGPDALGAIMTEELERWTAVIRRLNITQD